MAERAQSRLLEAVLLLAPTLVLPAVALERMAHGGEMLLLSAVPSIVSFAVYGFDKRQAGKRGAARVPEGRLLLIDLLGGWPGGLLAQRLWRHKTAKAGYQFAFWLVVTAYQAAAAWWLFR